MTGLNAPRVLPTRHLGTIIGLMIGIGFIIAAILLDCTDPPRPVAHAERRSWIPVPVHAERDIAKLEQPEEHP